MGGLHQTPETLPRIQTYREALAFWSVTKPWLPDCAKTYQTWDRTHKETHSLARYFELNGGTDNVKPLGNRSKKYRNVRMSGDDVVFRLYKTDIVTYHKDGRITLVPYCTKLTEEFCTMLLPDRLVAVYTVGGGRRRGRDAPFGPMVKLNGNYYLLSESEPYTFTRKQGAGTKAYYEPPTTMPFEKYVADRKWRRAMLAETEYTTFREVLTAVRALYGIKRGKVRCQIHPAWQNRKLWNSLVHSELSTSTILGIIRKEIYRGFGSKIVSQDYVTGRKELNSFVDNRIDR